LSVVKVERGAIAFGLRRLVNLRTCVARRRAAADMSGERTPMEGRLAHLKQQEPPKRGDRQGALDLRLMTMCLVLVVFGLVLIVQLPGRTVAMAERRKSDVEFREFADLFAEIYNKVEESYVDEVDDKKLFEGAINGMMSVLDPYSSWLPPAEQDLLTKDTEGEYSGVGLHITLDERRILTVLLPIIGSPASRQGVQPWDRIIEIDGESTESITLIEAVNRLTGPEGSEVTIKVWRPETGKLMDFTIKREQIRVESVFHKILDDGIGYVRISKFQDDTANRVREALEDFNSRNVRGVIADLRYNQGGLLERAQEICDMFLAKDQLIVSIKGRNERDNRDYFSLRDPLCNQPVIVLVNQFSASASEIFAGAIQDNHRGVIIGPKDESTFGKASVQTISPLRHSLDKDEFGNYRSSGLRLTTAHYYTPAGTLIMDKGITPDIPIELPPDHERMLREHGLLGEPSRLEPGNGDETTTGTTVSKDGDPSAKADGQKDSVDSSKRLIDMLENSSATQTEETDKFHDILLDESIKYLRAILIFEKDGRSAA
jgi:carboxyl-terminal processing protease